MQSLLDSVVALEKEADDLVEKARVEAQRIKSDAEEELLRYVEGLKHEREQRLKNKEREAYDLFQKAVDEEEHKINKVIQGIEDITTDIMQSQVDHILSRFREY